MYYGISRSRTFVRMSFMKPEKVIDRPTIGSHVSFESPQITQDRHHQSVIATTRLPFKTIIGTHHRRHAGIHHQLMESRQISIPQIISTHLRIEFVAPYFGTTVYGIMFCTSRSLQVFRIVTLQSFDDSRSHHPCQIRVFSICLLSPSPAGIPENIDIRCPKSQPFILLAYLTLTDCLVVNRTGFIGSNLSHPFQCRSIESRSHADRLRKNGHLIPRSSYPMQALVPPVVSRDSQTFDSHGRMLHL